MEDRHEEFVADGPLHIRVGNFEVIAKPQKKLTRIVSPYGGYRVLVNGKEVMAQDIKITGGAGRVWKVELGFLPTDEVQPSESVTARREG